jgi:sortase A
MEGIMKIKYSWKIILFPLLVGLLCLGNGFWIHGKAFVAQMLLQRAWEQSLGRGESIKPWPWADTWPVARLYAEKYDQDFIVLAGQSGQALAFGPGMLATGSKPGQVGSCVLAAHRDTHFSFLRRVQQGDILRLEDRQGRQWQYRVNNMLIRPATELYLAHQESQSLVLVTCYPFQGLEVDARQRFVVVADRI